MTQTHTITVEPLGREVECREDQTILDACLRSGVWLPHSCTHGTCATCKADVLDGDVDHGAASTFALMDYERDEGKLLPCTACPRSDVTIEADIDVDESIEVFPVQDYTGTVIELTEIARDTVRLVIGLDREIGFNAGQYLKFQVPARDGLPAVDRTWSIASPPTEPRRARVPHPQRARRARHRRLGVRRAGPRRHRVGLRPLRPLRAQDRGRPARHPRRWRHRPRPAEVDDPARPRGRRLRGPPHPLPGRPVAGVALRRGVLPLSRSASSPTSSPTARACPRRPRTRSAPTRRPTATAW